jgi:hypothetical protein
LGLKDIRRFMAKNEDSLDSTGFNPQHFWEIFGVSLAKNADLTKPKWKMMS